MKKLLAIALAALLATALLAGCGKKFNDVSAIQNNGEIVMYTDARWAPFEYIGEGGAAVGVDIDIANAIAQHLGVELRIINGDFDGMSLAVQNGQADMAIAAITITDERKESLDFSVPYTNSCQYIIVQEGNSEVTSIDDLAGLKVGVHLGTTGDLLVSEEINSGVLQGTGAEVVQYKTLQEGCLALLKGDLGAIVVDDLTAKNFCVVNPGLKCFEAAYADGSLDQEFYGVAVAKGNTTLVTEINAVLEEMIASGAVEASLDYHIEQSAVVIE